jgi:predicted DNA-binding protein (MmcQ/YjbR family)
LGNDLHQTVREACLWLPEAEEFVSHGAPNFRVRGKTFATFVVNHHGDGRVALWLPAPRGAQSHHLRADPQNFYVPPYVGVRGWIGVRIDRGLPWKRIAELVREAYEHVAPAALRTIVGPAPSIKAPARKLSAGDIDPFKSPRGRAVLKRLRKICLAWPETSEGSQFGHPVFKAGARTFAIARFDGTRLTACFWVGTDRQGLLMADERFGIPPYFGHNGWIALDVSTHDDPSELASLALESYRHFALKRMQRQL